MDIHEYEQLDGLSDKLKANSVAFVCDVKVVDKVSEPIRMAAIASIHDRPEQKDLYYLNSILVSAGWNKNDDVFSVADLWASRNTPVDKPFNYMHDESDIIGHMIASAACNQNGGLVTEEPLPDQMDLVTCAVIYTTWSDPEQSQKVQSLIQQIEAGELAVSMECVFNNFDYAIVQSDGTQVLVKRCADTAFLTKHLRAYGGTGMYNGLKIGRALTDLTFCGKGLVDKPANPRSLILKKDVNPFSPEVKDFSTVAMEVEMPDEVDKTVELQESLNAAKAEVDTHKGTISSLEAKIRELETTIATINDERSSLDAQIKSMVAEARQASRKNALLNAGADEAKASELLTKFAEASDEMFEVVVSLVKPVPMATPEASVTQTETEVEEVVETSTASVEDLDEVEQVDTPAPTVIDDTIKDEVAKAAEWLSTQLGTQITKK
jgi:hypothetical protein